MLNHSITRFNDKQKVRYRNSFVNRYIFPDGELTGPAKVMMAATGENWEVQREENIRVHYAKTLHCWRMNLEDNWDAAVAGLVSARHACGVSTWRRQVRVRAQHHSVASIPADGTRPGMAVPGYPLRRISHGRRGLGT